MLKTKQKIRKNCNLKKYRFNNNKLFERINAYNSILSTLKIKSVFTDVLQHYRLSTTVRADTFSVIYIILLTGASFIS